MNDGHDSNATSVQFVNNPEIQNDKFPHRSVTEFGHNPAHSWVASEAADRRTIRLAVAAA